MKNLRCLFPLLLLASVCAAQEAADTPESASPTEAPHAEAESEGQRPMPNPERERDVSINPIKFAPNFFSDQKRIYTFPAKLAKGRHLIPVLTILGVTAGIALGVDPTEGRYFRSHASTFDGFNKFLSENRTTWGTLLIPAAITAGGYIAKDNYLAHTGIFALEAWVDIDILDIAFRSAFRRRRPLDIPVNGNYHDTWFKTSGNPLTSSGSFPSGHTGWAFAVATVVARRYPDHKWVRFLAYGLAMADLASRVTSSNHFFADSVFGAALGYATGRFVVLRQ